MNRYATLPQLGRVEFGPMLPTERALVLASWTQSLVDSMGHGVRTGSPHRGVYLAATGKLVDGLFADSTVLVARDAECQALAYGWMAADPPLLHWTFTKGAYRRLGVAAYLFQAMTETAGELGLYSTQSRHSALAEKYGLRYHDRRKVAG